MARLELYADLLSDWNSRHNLVSETSLAQVWRRHFWDSAQLAPLVPPTARTLADLGSGAGFPGMVLAILGVKDVHLIESDVRNNERTTPTLGGAAEVAVGLTTAPMPH